MTQPVVSPVAQFHVDDFFHAGHILPVFIKDASHDGQLIVAAAKRLAEVDGPHIQMRQHGKTGRFIFLEVLCLQVHGKIVDFLLRE